MATVGVRELKTNLAKILHDVEERGEPVEITRRGKVIARLTPVEAETVRIWSEAEREAFWAEWNELIEDIGAKAPPAEQVAEIMRDMRR